MSPKPDSELGAVNALRRIRDELVEDWALEDSPVRRVAHDFGLRAFAQTTTELATYTQGKRLDWNLFSKELEFIADVVLPDVVPDHRALLARICWAGGR
jgi:hypothetical protein